MPPQDLSEALHHHPFRPFRLVLTDGKQYEIRHPELFMLGKRSAVIGLVKPDDPEPLYDHYVTVDLLHIVRMEPLDASAAAG
jgi:hypothetical protein